jgi:hypothetical protein
VPDFPAITSFIKLLWNDPVWSKVIAAGIVALIALIGAWIFGDHKAKWPQIGMIFFAIGFIGCAIWYWSARGIEDVPKPPATTATPKQASLPPMPSILSLFMTDFAGKGSGGGIVLLGGAHAELTLPDDTKLEIFYNIIQDFGSRSKFITFYIEVDPENETLG